MSRKTDRPVRRGTSVESQPFVQAAEPVAAQVDGDVAESVAPHGARRRLRHGRLATSRGISSGATSMRATSPWCRTRRTRKPSARSASSAPSIARSFSSRDLGEIRNPRGQAGRRRLVPGGQTGLARQRADVVLGQPRFIERADDAELAGGTAAGPVVAAVVGVAAVGHGRETRASVGERRQACVQLVLAVIAAIGCVGAVLRVAPVRRCGSISWRQAEARGPRRAPSARCRSG